MNEFEWLLDANEKSGLKQVNTKHAAKPPSAFISIGCEEETLKSAEYRPQ